MNSGPSQHLNSIMASSIVSNSQHGQASYPQANNKQSSFGSVFYDSNRKTRESNAVEENRLKQASSLSPTRMIQDMSRQDATSLMMPQDGGGAPALHQMNPMAQTNGSMPTNMFGVHNSSSPI